MELLRSLRPDQVIVATGAIRSMPDLPGSDLNHVFSGDDLRGMMLGESSVALKRKTGLVTRLVTRIGAALGVTNKLELVRGVTRRWMPLGQRIVIIGGELVGVELAEFLVERGRTVTVIEEAARFGKGLTVVRRMRLIPELREHGVALFAQARDIRVTPNDVVFSTADGERHVVRADNVIIAKGAHGDPTLANSLRAEGFDVTDIGDCRDVTYIEGAIRGAARATLGEAAIPVV